MTRVYKSLMTVAVMVLAVTSASVSFGQVPDAGWKIPGYQSSRMQSRSRSTRPPTIVYTQPAPTERRSFSIEPTPPAPVAAPSAPQVTGTPRVVRTYTVEPAAPTFTRPRTSVRKPAYLYQKTDPRRYSSPAW